MVLSYKIELFEGHPPWYVAVTIISNKMSTFPTYFYIIVEIIYTYTNYLHLLSSIGAKYVYLIPINIWTESSQLVRIHDKICEVNIKTALKNIVLWLLIVSINAKLESNTIQIASSNWHYKWVGLIYWTMNIFFPSHRDRFCL